MVVATTGFFDGVHRGHRSVIQKVCDVAKSHGHRSSVITFWPHPRAVLQQDAAGFRLLTSLEEKKKILLSLGIDEVNIINFDKDFARLTTAEFLKSFLIDRFCVTHLIVGYDHRMGCDLNQTQNEMLEVANSLGIETIRVGEYVGEEEKISSTKIRSLISGGDIVKANSLLGYRYSLYGVVVEGQRIGRKMGFPTANMRLYEPLKLVPSDGVYAVWVHSGNNVYRGITNIGTRPTIAAGNERTIETHILEFDEDIYGLSLELEFVYKMRDEKAFGSIDELKGQLSKDREESYHYLVDYNKI